MSDIYQKLRTLQLQREAIAAALRSERVAECSAESFPAASATSTPPPVTAAEAAPSLVAPSMAAPPMAAPLTPMLEHIVAVAKFRRELDERVSSTGVAGVEDLLMLFDRLRSGLDCVLPDEIEEAGAQLGRLRDALAHLGDELRRLKTLKLELPLED